MLTRSHKILQSTLVTVLHYKTEPVLGVLVDIEVANYEPVDQLVEDQSLLLGHLLVGDIHKPLDGHFVSLLGVVLLHHNLAEVHTAESSRPESSDLLEIVSATVVVVPDLEAGEHVGGVHQSHGEKLYVFRVENERTEALLTWLGLAQTALRGFSL